MQRLMSPALAVMNRLKYPQKFLLVGLLLVLPLGLVLTQYITQINKDIDFAAKEELGLQYNQPLFQLYRAIEMHEAYMNTVMSGDKTFTNQLDKTQAEISTLIKSVDEVDARLGKTLATTQSWQDLKTQWQDLLQQMKMTDQMGMMMMTREQSADKHLAVSTSILSLITEVGNNSNLILDPDIDSYYLMYMVIVQFPQSASYLSQIRSLGLTVALNAGSPADKTRLEVLAGLSESTVDTIIQDFDYVFGANGPLKGTLDAPSKGYKSNVNQFLGLVRQRLVGTSSASQPLTGVEDYFNSATQTVDGTFDLYNLASPALDNLLHIRINRLTGQRTLVIVVALVALVLSVYLVIAFYLVVMRTIARLDDASKQMVTGTTTEMVKLDNKDELGQIALSFNNIARVLVSTSTSLRTIVDNAADGILTFDRQGRIETFNAAAEQIFGYQSAEIVGQPVARVIEQSYVEKLNGALNADNLKEIRSIHEIEGRGKDGAAFPMEISLSEAVLEGRMIFTAILRDVTERKQTEAALQIAYKNLAQRTHDLEIASVMAKEANRLKSQFLSTMSHELRTPLNAMIGFTDLLLTAKPGPLTDKQHMFLDRVADNSRRLLSLINSVLDLSRIEAGRMEILFEAYSPHAMLERVTSLSSSLFSQKNLAFKTSFDPLLPSTVIGDQDRVEQIVVNLLSNAAKFTTVGEVELSALKVNEESWSISVRDTGAGIAPHMQEIIFEPFRQADGTTTRQFGGTGLGLTISRELCQMMDGNMRLHSELGKGSTFTVILPIGPVSTDDVLKQSVSVNHNGNGRSQN